MDDIFGEEHVKPYGVDTKTREAYRAVFFSQEATQAQRRQVFSDILAQTQLFTAARSGGFTPAETEAKREIGLYLLIMIGMAPSADQDIFDSMNSLVQMFAQNNMNRKNQVGDSR